MKKLGSSPSRVLLVGLESILEQQLRQALGGGPLNVQVESCASPEDGVQWIRRDRPECVFMAFSLELLALLRALDDDAARVPVVVVSPYPEVREWLDAMEAGASDYCAAPFEPRQLHWILESNSTLRSVAAAPSH